MKVKVEDANKSLSELKSEIDSIDGQLKSINVESIDISKTIERREYLLTTSIKASTAKADKVLELETKTAEFDKITEFLTDFDVVTLNEKKEEIKDYQSKLSAITQDLQLNNKETKYLKDKIKLLGEVQCGTQF